MKLSVYLLRITRENQKNAEMLAGKAFSKVDSVRRDKAMKIKAISGRLTNLAAGLLLQKIVADYTNQSLWLENASPENANPGGEKILVRDFCLEGLLDEILVPVDIAYDIGEKGKPTFRDIPVCFNLSHSGEYIACAVSDEPVGVDIQQIVPAKIEKITARFYGAEDLERMSQCKSQEEMQEMFFQIWTRKEALAKYLGISLAEVFENTMTQADVFFYDLQLADGYKACVCTGKQ